MKHVITSLFVLLFTASLAHASTLTPLTIHTQSGKEYSFDVELAHTPKERSIGLMHRQSLDANAGMVFLYQTPHHISMWMKNTPLPLDMIFIRKNNTIAHIEHNTTPFSLETITAPEPCTAVLEINAGISKKLGIQPGDAVLHSSLAQ